MKQQLHRSVTFWSGLLAMAFTAWGWWDSFHHVSGLSYRRMDVMNDDGGVHATYRPGAHWSLEARYFDKPLQFPRFGPIQPWVFMHGRYGGGPREGFATLPHNVRDLYFMTTADEPPGYWILFIPHWLLLLAVALPWLALLLWRARRRQRAHVTTP
jgi:hypothetical protein